MISWIPRWKDDPNFNAQAAHFLAGYAATMTGGHFGGKKWTAIFFAATIIYASLKEFWYDATYELPPQSTADNIEDFCSYAIGAIIGGVISVS